MTESLGKTAEAALDRNLKVAEGFFQAGKVGGSPLSVRLAAALDKLNERAQSASAVFTNIMTCLAIKAARPDIDVRYHQVQIQNRTSRPAGENFRGISENEIYPWLSRNRFDGAKSGWQTRTLERPKPYIMDYDENIAYVKPEFLAVFDELEEHGASADAALSYILYKQILRRETLAITLAIPKTIEIAAIVDLFKRHFFKSYSGAKGASRLPVLALHALYSVAIPQLRRYDGKSLRPLQLHSAADSQTGSVGDIEVVDDATGNVFEAVEVKHNIGISEAIADDVQRKVMTNVLQRYYVLTTSDKCEPDVGAKKIFENIKDLYNCQVIANGVIPTIRYYLRLLDDPSVIFESYVSLLKEDKAIAHEHRIGWNEIVQVR